MLAGHALAPPADAPKDAAISGKFTGAAQVMEPETVMGNTGAAHGKRPTGIMLPSKSQPQQGLSGFAMTKAEDGSIYVLTDNGFGSKANSPDAMLFFHRGLPDFATDASYLTGADFDTESIQLLNGGVWLGDEFGPDVIRASLDGTVLAVYPTMLGEAILKGPDTPGISAVSVMGKD